MQSVPIFTNVASSNPEVYSILLYVIKCVSDWVGRWCSPVSSANKTDWHDIMEIMLKVAFTTITPNPTLMGYNWTSMQKWIYINFS